MRALSTFLAAAFSATLALHAPARAQAPEKPAAAPARKPEEASAPEKRDIQKLPRLALDSRPLPLGGALKTPALWQAYRAQFVTEQGRVVDTGNQLISHSEGQGYGMLLAVAANDRATFDKIWGWTRANLMVRDDQLIAWRWEPHARPAVADLNDASDGDILIAWALAEASDYWGDMSHRTAGRRIAVELARKVVLFKSTLGAVLLPAVAGFSAQDRPDGPVVNLSYYVFPAFSRLSLVAPEVDWAGLTQTGLDLLDHTRTTPTSLPADWLSLQGDSVKPAEGFPPQFSYNAVRVPLYLAFAGVGEREHYAPFMTLVERTRGNLAIVDVASGRDVGAFGGGGVGAIGALTACIWNNAKAPREMTAAFAPGEDYYPATMRLLALIAMQMRRPACLRG